MALRELTRSLRNRQRPVDTVQKLRSIGPGAKYILGTGVRFALAQRRIPPSVDAGWSDLSNNDKRYATLEAIQQIELAPDPGNRVSFRTRSTSLGRDAPS